jgi:hypothetical protein
MTPSLFDPQSLVQPLPWPPEHKHVPTARRLEDAHSRYLAAFIKAQAVDHPYSRHTTVPEAEKATLRAERWEAVHDLQQKYQQLLERALKPKQPKAPPKQPSTFTAPFAQQRLFSDAWPEAFTPIAERFPRRPYVSSDLTFSTVRPLDQAEAWRYIQHNPPAHAHLLVVDYDQDDGLPAVDVWRVAGLPAPAWVASTPGTNRGHLAWALAAPVCTTSAGHLAPLRYLAAIEQAYKSAVTGDQNYVGLLTKNPIYSGLEPWNVTWIDPTPRSLGELAAAVSLPAPGKKAAPIKAVGFGRKVATFDTVRNWAYTAVSSYWLKGEAAWHAAVRAQVDAMNTTFTDALLDSHCRSIAKSIGKWVWARFTPLTKHQMVQATHTPEVQAMRGRLKGAKVRNDEMAEALKRLSGGETAASVAADLGVTDRTLRNWRMRAEKAYIR